MGNVVNIFGESLDIRGTQSMDAQAFRIDLIRPALKVVGMWSESAENLLLGTAIAESGLRVVKQFAGGPAISFFQIEPDTYADCVRYLNRRDKAKIKSSILSACYLDILPPFESLAWNIRLAILIARVKYWMQKPPLPHHEDIVSIGSYWKSFYNSARGEGTVEHFVEQWGKHGCERI